MAITSAYKVQNELETKRNESKSSETKRNIPKQNETYRNKMKSIGAKGNKSYLLYVTILICGGSNICSKGRLNKYFFLKE